MSGKIRLSLAAALALSLVRVADVPAMARCGDTYTAIALGPFPADAQTTTPLFYASDDTGTGSFNVQWTGLSCGAHFEVTAEYGDIPGSAVEGADYSVPAGERTPTVCSNVCPGQAAVSFPVTDDGPDTQVAEAFSIVLTNPAGGSIEAPPSAPFVLVDADGSTRVALDELPYSQSESFATLAVAVWLAGPSTGPTIPFTVGPGPGSGATPGADYTVTTPSPLVFGAGDRVELITLSIVNDQLSEGDETVQIDLQGPVVAPATKVVTIHDNEENVLPSSRLHHPRHKWRYKKSDYRIREIHVFAHDDGGSGVVGAELALRRNLRNGDCVWWTVEGWQKKDCSNRQWLGMTYSPGGDLFFYRMKQLKSSVGTPIKNYIAFSRAIDGAGNVEKQFNEKRNANTFEVKRARRR
jgi:hypothetical protein